MEDIRVKRVDLSNRLRDLGTLAPDGPEYLHQFGEYLADAIGTEGDLSPSDFYFETSTAVGTYRSGQIDVFNIAELAGGRDFADKVRTFYEETIEPTELS